MTDTFVVAYVLATLFIGTTCVGAALVLARLRGDALARAFLLFYVPLSALVLTALSLAWVEVMPAATAGSVFALEYLEAFPGRYGVMLGLPLFAHRVFAVGSRRRDAAILCLVLAAFAGQHVTEYVAGGPWDGRGDVAEDVLFAGVVAYTVWIGLRRLEGEAVYRPLARCFLATLLLGLPALGHDLFIVDGGGPRLYPLWYGAVGAATVAALVRRRSAGTRPVPASWKLSPREEEVVGLVRLGLSNKEIARQLTISPNTVKTHLRAVFGKSGFRSRVALIATLAGAGHPPEDAATGRNHPDG